MNQKHFLVEHLSNINAVIKHPLKLKQRIKFTCFDVSRNYIVFGATSGGLYVFNRYPHVFLKLIPSTVKTAAKKPVTKLIFELQQGSVVQVAIAPNEKTIVLASSKGLIVVIENCFTEANVQYQVYSEHEGKLVTVVQWHLDDVYCGDNKGKVSVIMLPNLLTKAIFQTPCSSLMQLDSAVVQIECYSKFLLISTRTRTYICDTDKEQYRQIGKKLRDGSFGACFFANDSPEVASVHTSTSGSLFKNLKDDEQFSPSVSDNVKIFCARPGARMWEAKLDASVTRTHQFKNFLKQKATSIIHLSDDANAHLKLTNFSESAISTSELFNFTKVILLENKFILTFNREGFYVFSPESVALTCWCNYFQNIKDVKIVKNFIYIWNERAEVHVVGLYELEKIILKTLFNKQYYFSSELCINYIEEVLELVKISEKIHLVSILKDKLVELDAQDLIEKLAPLFKAIKEVSDEKCSGHRLTTGIVAVKNSYIDKDAIFDESVENKYDQQLPETLQTLKEIGFNVTDKLTESTKNLKEKLQILEATVKNLTLNDGNASSDASNSELNNSTVKVDLCECDENVDSESIVETKIQPKAEVEPSQEVNSNIKVIFHHYQLTKMNPNIEIPKFNQIFHTNNLNDIVELFQEFLQHMKEKDLIETNTKFWCYKHYLKQLVKRDFEVEIENLDVSDSAMSYLSEAFRAINFSSQHSCQCLFPLPLARIKLPYYYEVGCAILKKYYNSKHESFKELHKEVPYMWKCIVREWKKDDDIDVVLPLLLQFGDEDLITEFLYKIKYDTWDNAVQLLIKLNKSICINCDNNFQKVCDVMSWTTFAKLMVQSIGGPSTINLLSRYANFIPSNELSSDFYQSCIFATAADNFRDGLRTKAMDLAKIIQANENTALQFDTVMAKFLQKKYINKPVKYLKKGLLDDPKTDSNCSFCDLPIDVPLLNDDVRLQCNHTYHKICLKCNENICKKCQG